MSTSIRFAGPLVLLGVFASALALAGEPPERAALEAAGQRWTRAFNDQDTGALAATMTEDVELLAHTAVRGRDAAIAALREARMRGRLIATSREIDIIDDVAWRAVELVQSRKNAVHARSQALEIWQRVNGEWKLHRQMSMGIIDTGITLTRPSTSEPVLDQPKN